MQDTLLARRLRLARARTRLSQRQVAERAGLHAIQISKLERGFTKDISGQTLRALCGVLGCSADYILGISDEAPDETHPDLVVTGTA
jgi:transcriptional regulator with XRE-family HTH domain